MEFEVTATKDKNGNYRHFGISPLSSSLYGDRPEDIVTLVMEVADDQSVPENYIEPVDYWGWYSTEKAWNHPLVFQQHFLLNMCFPYGMKVEEERGEGKAFRLIVKKVIS